VSKSNSYRTELEYRQCLDACKIYGTVVEFNDGEQYEYKRHPSDHRRYRCLNKLTGNETLWTLNAKKMWKENLHQGMYDEKVVEVYLEILDGGLKQFRGNLPPETTERGFLSVMTHKYNFSCDDLKTTCNNFWNEQDGPFNKFQSEQNGRLSLLKPSELRELREKRCNDEQNGHQSNKRRKTEEAQQAQQLMAPPTPTNTNTFQSVSNMININISDASSAAPPTPTSANTFQSGAFQTGANMIQINMSDAGSAAALLKQVLSPQP